MTENDVKNDNKEVVETKNDNNGIGDIVGDVIDSAPEYVIDEPLQQVEVEITDKKGEKFDPERHKIDPETKKPLFTKRGAFKKIRKSHVNKPTPKKEELSTEENAKQVDSEACRKAAEVLVQTGFGVAEGVMGPEWKPLKADGIDEYEHMVGAFQNKFEKDGITDLPPNLTILVGIAIISARRMTMPETQKRTKGFFKKAYSGFMAWKNRRNKKFKKQGGVNAHSDSGANGIGKELAGETDLSIYN